MEACQGWLGSQRGIVDFLVCCWLRQAVADKARTEFRPSGVVVENIHVTYSNLD